MSASTAQPQHFSRASPHQSPAAWLAQARSLRESGALSEADHLLSKACSLFPQNSDIAHEYARSAERLGLVPESIDRWQAAHERLPNDLGACLNLAAMLTRERRFDEAERVCETATSRFPDRWQAFAEHANLAEKRGDKPAALQIWAKVRQVFPELSIGYTRAAITLTASHKVDEAERLIADALKRFPDDSQLLGAAAFAAEARQDWHAALTYIEAALRTRPDHQGLIEKRICLLRISGDLAKALAEADSAAKRFPASTILLEEQASLAVSLARWDEALGHWHDIRARTPAAIKPVLEIARILARQRRFEDADRFLAGDFSAISDRLEIEIERAHVARQAGDKEGNLRLWAALYDRYPNEARIVTGITQSYMDLRNEQACRPLIARLLENYKNDWPAQACAARFFIWQEQPEVAVALVTEAASRWPGHKHVAATLRDVRMHLQMKALAEGQDPEAARSRDPVGAAGEANVARSLPEQFVSLGGDDGGCEFGIVQRHLGAEPLGLLRWGNISPDGLTRLIEQRCEGLGTTANMKLLVDGGGEYRLIDALYDIAMHTFIGADKNPPETLLPKLANRQVYLGGDLMDVLEEGGHIFVYKATKPLEPERLLRIFRAIRAHGRNALLVVQSASADLPAGKLRIVEPGLMIGAIDQFSTRDISFKVWSELCRAASEAWVNN